MTLDRRLTAHTIKGHFCSLLISNIVWLSSLSQSTLCLHRATDKTLFIHFLSLKRIHIVFVQLVAQKANGQLSCEGNAHHTEHIILITSGLQIYIHALHRRVFTPVRLACRHPHVGVKSENLTCHWTVPSFLRLYSTILFAQAQLANCEN